MDDQKDSGKNKKMETLDQEEVSDLDWEPFQVQIHLKKERKISSGFEVLASHGADIGKNNLPFFNQIGGMMFNQGTRVGALGHRYGNGPARSMNALSHG